MPEREKENGRESVRESERNDIETQDCRVGKNRKSKRERARE